MDFLKFIGDNYEKILKIISSYKDYNEDVFHNTIIKCNEICQENQLKFTDENQILRYFIGAYKTNVLREKLYYYNKNSDHEAELSSYDRADYEEIEMGTEVLLIKDDIENKFGKELKDVYIRYVSEDLSIQELQKQTGVKNLKQKLKDIREYITEKYSSEDLF